MNLCPRKHLGAKNEFIASVWLLRAGYEVFRNISHHGCIDLVALKDDEIHYFDVKQGVRKTDGSFSRFSLKSAPIKGIKILYVFTDETCEIEENPRTQGLTTKICPHCQISFSNSKRSPYCSIPCRQKEYDKRRQVG